MKRVTFILEFYDDEGTDPRATASSDSRGSVMISGPLWPAEAQLIAELARRCAAFNRGDHGARLEQS